MSSFALDASKFKEILYEILKVIKLDSSLVETQVSNVINSEIKYIPIRHHSPGSALLVKKAIEKYKPKLVLIEGPYLANNLIKFMIDEDTLPPFAIFSIFADQQNEFKLNGILSPDITVPAKFQVYYPFISYSPELVALIECNKRKIKSFFIDLPLTGQIPYMINEENTLLHFLKQEEEQFVLSDFYRVLAQVFQFNSFDETWDSLFEIGTNRGDIEQIREALLTFCSCIRQTISNETSVIEGSIAREQFMKFMINEIIDKEGVEASKVMVITGGLHSVILPKTNPVKIEYSTKGLFNSLVPYSYFRISDSSGYGSGNQGPSFYDYIWEKFQTKVKYPFETTALELITDIFDDARKKGHAISIADTINSFQNTKMLAMMRRRDEPALIDIIDSIFMSLVKGNPDLDGGYLNELIKNRIIGFKVGKITKKIGKLPLQDDFYLKMEHYQIHLEEIVKNFSLNLRKEHDLEVSQFFWRIFYLDLGILDRKKGPDLIEGETGIFTELWSLIWSPKVDEKLIELNIYGSTIEEASKNKLIEESKKQLKNFQKISKLLYQSLLMGLPVIFHNLYDICIDSIELDSQYVTLSNGFNNCVMIYRYLKMMDNQKTNLKIVENLVLKSFFASCFIMPQFANPPQDIGKDFVAAIRDIATTLINFSDINIDIDIFYESLKTCIYNSQDDFIKGCCTGILHLMNYYDTNKIKDEISEYTKSEDSIKIKLGEYIHGLIFECKTKLLFNDEIIKLLCQIIEALEWNIFTAILPSLRKSFSELETREYDVFAERISVIYGLKTKEIKELNEEIGDHLKIFFSEIDGKVKKIFNDWFGEI